MPRRIAIVEDDPVIRANYADVLKKHGYEVILHANRPDALAALRTRLPDLVLLDIGLGDEIDGGFALCRELRALSGTLPIIFLTARDGDFDTVSGLRMGAVEVNPMMKAVVQNPVVFIAVKSAITAASIYQAERLWKDHRRVAAIALMVATNSLMAVVAKNNHATLSRLQQR